MYRGFGTGRSRPSESSDSRYLVNRLLIRASGQRICVEASRLTISLRVVPTGDKRFPFAPLLASEMLVQTTIPITLDSHPSRGSIFRKNNSVMANFVDTITCDEKQVADFDKVAAGD